MNMSGDAAEQVVRISLEGFEVAARLTGTAAKNVAVLLMAALREEGKTKGKTRLSNMIRSGKELKVFSIPQKDLQKFTEQAKKYGVLYTVLREKKSKDGEIPVDIIARAEDASKIQRIVDRFKLGTVDKAAIVAEVKKDLDERQETVTEQAEKTLGDQIVEEVLGSEAKENPAQAKAETKPLSWRDSGNTDIKPISDVGDSDRPSVHEKLERYIQQSKKQKEAERQSEAKDKPKTQKKNQPRETKHMQPKKKRKSRER